MVDGSWLLTRRGRGASIAGGVPKPLHLDRRSGLYRVMARGTARLAVVFCDADRERFAVRPDEDLEAFHVISFACAPMHEHFHLIVRTSVATPRYLNRTTRSLALRQ